MLHTCQVSLLVAPEIGLDRHLVLFQLEDSFFDTCLGLWELLQIISCPRLCFVRNKVQDRKHRHTPPSEPTSAVFGRRNDRPYLMLTFVCTRSLGASNAETKAFVLTFHRVSFGEAMYI
jgi:hypothetical protein